MRPSIRATAATPAAAIASVSVPSHSDVPAAATDGDRQRDGEGDEADGVRHGWPALRDEGTLGTAGSHQVGGEPTELVRDRRSPGRRRSAPRVSCSAGRRTARATLPGVPVDLLASIVGSHSSDADGERGHASDQPAEGTSRSARRRSPHRPEQQPTARGRAVTTARRPAGNRRGSGRRATAGPRPAAGPRRRRGSPVQHSSTPARNGSTGRWGFQESRMKSSPRCCARPASAR